MPDGTDSIETSAYRAIIRPKSLNERYLLISIWYKKENKFPKLLNKRKKKETLSTLDLNMFNF
jgi:hypothetical protein